MQEIVDRGIYACTNEIFDIAWKGTNGIYWSWDTDSLDASCMPGTTAPETFGIKPREALELARIAGTFGADVFEISEFLVPFPAFVIPSMSASSNGFPLWDTINEFEWKSKCISLQFFNPASSAF